jgi:hypothetical protein
MNRQLEVNVRILPPSPDITPEEFDFLSEGAVQAYEAWVQSRKAKAGGVGGEPLTAVERGTVKGFLYFVATESKEQ